MTESHYDTILLLYVINRGNKSLVIQVPIFFENGRLSGAIFRRNTAKTVSPAAACPTLQTADNNILWWTFFFLLHWRSGKYVKHVKLVRLVLKDKLSMNNLSRIATLPYFALLSSTAEFFNINTSCQCLYYFLHHLRLGKKPEYVSIFSGTYTIWTILKMILGRNTSLILLSDSDPR